MKVIGYCEACRHRHPIDFDPFKPDDQFSDWRVKHGHCVRDDGNPAMGFLWPERTTYAGWMERLKRFWTFRRDFVGAIPSIAAVPRWRGALCTPDAVAAFLDNSDVKVAFGSSAAVTIDCSSLATSSTKLAGRESTAIDNSSNKYLDYLLSGLITVGTTPTTAKSIDICLVGLMNDTSSDVWPDVFDGTDSAETVTNQEIKDQICKPFQTISVISTTSNVGYNYGPGSVASRFGGIMPKKFVLFVTHDTAVNLNSTAGNHVQSVLPQYLTVI